VEFTEVNDEDKPLTEPKQFDVLGKRVYVEGRIVKFDDRYVEEADALRGKPLFAFERIYGDQQAPSDGAAIDKPGQRPAPYATPRPVSDFEKQIWDDFWDIVHDDEKKKSLGVRSGQGEAPFQEVRKGQRYLFKLRASGDPIFEHAGESPKKPAPTL
jgi:hypothetical protein